MDSSSGLLVMSGSSCAGMSDFTAMKTLPPPQSDRSFLNTVYSEGKHEYVGSPGLSFDSQPKIMSGFELSMWLAKMAARSELLMLLQLISIQRRLEQWRKLVDVRLFGVLEDTGGAHGSIWSPRSCDKAKNELLELKVELELVLLNARLLEKVG